MLARSLDEVVAAVGADVMACLTVGRKWKAGDQAPDDYLNWHEWASVQHRAGLRQRKCGTCLKWKFPQELSPEVEIAVLTTSLGEEVQFPMHRCLKCITPSSVAAVKEYGGGS